MAVFWPACQNGWTRATIVHTRRSLTECSVSVQSPHAVRYPAAGLAPPLPSSTASAPRIHELFVQLAKAVTSGLTSRSLFPRLATLRRRNPGRRKSRTSKPASRRRVALSCLHFVCQTRERCSSPPRPKTKAMVARATTTMPRRSPTTCTTRRRLTKCNMLDALTWRRRRVARPTRSFIQERTMCLELHHPPWQWWATRTRPQCIPPATG